MAGMLMRLPLHPRGVLAAAASAVASGRIGNSTYTGVMRVLKSLFSRIWPLSKRSAGTWTVLLVVLYGVWGRTFIKFGETNTVKQERLKKRKRLEELQTAILLYAAAERAKKKKEDQKMPEARRVYTLLWDETFTCKVTRYGLKQDGAEFMAVEALLKETLADELGKCIELTTKAREVRLKKTSSLTPKALERTLSGGARAALAARALAPGPAANPPRSGGRCRAVAAAATATAAVAVAAAAAATAWR